MKLTDWYDGSQTPVHVGFYQRKFVFAGEENILYSYWDGRRWYVGGYSIKEAYNYMKHDYVSCCQESSWRGVAEDSRNLCTVCHKPPIFLSLQGIP